MDRHRAVGIALVLVSACAFGSGALFAKPVYGTGVDWLTLSAWRFGTGASLAWAWLLLSAGRRRGLRRLSRRGVAVSLALGVLYTGNSATYYAGLVTVPASLAALIVYIYPAIVAVLSLRIGRRLEGRRAWSALGLALVGVALAIGNIDAAAVPPISGLALMVASPIIYSVWIVLAARLSGERRADLPERPEEGADVAAAGALMMTATATMFWTMALASGRPVLPGQIPAAAWPGLLAIGAISTFVAIQSFYSGARRIGAAQAALVSTIEPVWTIGLAALLLAESLQPLQLVGGTLILVGVIIAQTASSGARPQVRIADE